MQSLYSSVLVIGHPSPHQLEIGADCVHGWSEAEAAMHKAAHKVVVFPYSLDAEKYLQNVKLRYHNTQIVLIQGSAHEEQLVNIINTGLIFRIVPTFSDPQIERHIQEALEHANLVQQQEDLIRIVAEQTTRLQTLRDDLEERVQKRQKYLEQSKKKLLETGKYVEAWHAALVAIHRARSLAELERLLLEALSNYMQLEWLRVLFQSHNSFEDEREFPGFEVHRTRLEHNETHLGTLLFARIEEHGFRKEERDFFEQIGETVTLALDRLVKLQQSETLKQQWDATFDAILDPLCLTDKNFHIIRTNKAFAKLADKPLTSLIGQHCFEEIFQTQPELDNAQFGDRFEIRKVRSLNDFEQTLLIHGQMIPMSASEEPVRLVLFRDLTDSLQLEKQILESAKMAELGTIGSSIAHELNNPVGGMMSFLQLITMDLKSTDPIYTDVMEMEKATQRCKEIVQNLLGFARRHEQTDIKDLDLREVIQQSLKITELQSRSQGVVTEVKLPDREVPFKGHGGLLSQAIRNVLQNATEAVLTKAEQSTTFIPKIKVEVKILKQDYQIIITDNGVGIEEKNLNKIFNPLFTTKDPSLNSGLGLTVAFKIIHEHTGTLEISSKLQSGTTARIAFRRPDFPSHRQVFDGKI